jgi:hypothetical protein
VGASSVIRGIGVEGHARLHRNAVLVVEHPATKICFVALENDVHVLGNTARFIAHPTAEGRGIVSSHPGVADLEHTIVDDAASAAGRVRQTTVRATPVAYGESIQRKISGGGDFKHAKVVRRDRRLLGHRIIDRGLDEGAVRAATLDDDRAGHGGKLTAVERDGVVRGKGDRVGASAGGAIHRTALAILVGIDDGFAQRTDAITGNHVGCAVHLDLCRMQRTPRHDAGKQGNKPR